MSDIGALVDYPLNIISVSSPACIGIETVAYTAQIVGTNAWPSSNLAIYIPMKIGYIFIAQKMLWVNGATVTNNTVDVGIYDSQGNRLVHSGATTTSGVSVMQSVTITATTLYPGLYYLAMVVNGTTDTFLSSATGAINCAACGMLSQTSASPLPATATFSSTITSYVPEIAISGNTIV